MRRIAWGVLLAGVAGGMVVLADLAWTWVRFGPHVTGLAEADPRRTAFMARRARQGRPPVDHRWVPLDSLPRPVVCAVVAAENARFFQHGTLDWVNQRAMLSRVLRGDFARGGSGIAQQLARNLFLTPDRTVRRKLREYVLAYKISHGLTKERQLELYLNMVEWGEGIWGVAAGSEHHFGRPVDALTPTETVLLANLLPAPTRGVDFVLSPPRRNKSEIVAGHLWRELLFDDLTLWATLARLRRLGDYVDQGLGPSEAARAVDEEMGTEPILPDPAAGEPVRETCDLTRRGL